MDTYNQGECSGATGLQKEVLTPGLCTVCGACAGYCPYIKTLGERVAVIQDCKICGGVCYRICPRCFTDYSRMRQEVFGNLNFDPVLGTHASICFARAKDEASRSRGQYGGVITALTRYAMERGLIDCSLVTGGTPSGAKPSLCSTPGELLEKAGSKYTAVPTLSLFHQTIKSGFQRIGVVGRPCQVTASRKMQHIDEINGKRISLVIGLFCFWSLSSEFYFFLKKKGLDNCSRMDIPKEEVFFRKEDGSQIKMQLEEIRPFIKKTCLACYDPLSELADISVGSTEYDPGWNTLVVRTQKGKQLVEESVEAGMIELKPYPRELLPALRRAVFQKKKRVLERPDTAYVGVPPGERTMFAEGGEVL